MAIHARGGLALTPPRWLEIAWAELGVREIEGPQSNRRVLEYHAATSLRATDDDVPWCSAFLCWCFTQAGEPNPGDARARSWLTWGEPSPFPALGDVVILQRSIGNQAPATVLNAPGHVGLFVGFGDTTTGGSPARILLLAGNQNNRVCVQSFGSDLVLGIRRPRSIQGGQ